MKLPTLPCRAAAFALALAAAPATASNQYTLDDGELDVAIGSSLPVDFGWLQRFDAVGGTDLITDVQIWIPGITDGRPVHLCVWEDPNDDGDPIDAILVATVTGPVRSTPGFARYALPNPGLVQGRFFVGAYLTVDGGPGPAAIDKDAIVPNIAWATWNPVQGGFDHYDLGNNFPPFHVETLSASFHGAFLLRATGAGHVPTVYCSAKTNSLGCVPHVGFAGIPSASAGSGFVVSAANVLDQKSGFLMYGTSGPADVPFAGGTLCVAAPLHHTPLQTSGGSGSGTNCTGTYAFDFNAWIASGIDRTLVAGAQVHAQYWSRDPGFALPDNVGLTEGLEFTLQP